MTMRIDLAPKLDFRAAEALLGQIRAARGSDLVLDGAAVDHLGVQAAQLIMCATQSWIKDRKAFDIEGLPDAIHAQLAEMGLSHDDMMKERAA
ncbi:MAG: STAS domain-containing protein [Rhodobacteraceae bacterium]|nr:STAS domain-containing protein [Paracoccaceae bacterium]